MIDLSYDYFFAKITQDDPNGKFSSEKKMDSREVRINKIVSIKGIDLKSVSALFFCFPIIGSKIRLLITNNGKSIKPQYLEIIIFL